MKQKLISFYLEYFNEYLTISTFAELKGFTDKEAIELIEIGKKYHEEHSKEILKQFVRG